MSICRVMCKYSRDFIINALVNTIYSRQLYYMVIISAIYHHAIKTCTDSAAREQMT